jgi:AAA ATPase domain/MalT-like TPR region
MPRRKENEGGRAGADGEHPEEPLVDRRLELDLFRDHIARVARGEPGRAVLVLGESGVGKSRLAAEVRREARKAGMMAITAQCLGTGAEPLLPLREGLASYLGRSPASIRRSLAMTAPLLLDAIPFIGAFLGKLGEKLAEGLAGASFEGVYEELARILFRLAGDSGLFLLVEDLHAADSDTLYFLNYLFRKIRDYRVLAVVTIQEERIGELPHMADLVAQWTASGYATLTVVPLERAHVGEYVQQAAAAGRPADEATVDRLFQLTGGNPFFLRETLHLLAQAPEPRSVPEMIPPGTDAVLRRRLARADDLTLRFLRAASVVLETSQEMEPVRYVMEGEVREAISALDAACRLRLMREGPDGEISFVHSLMQRQVYAELGANQRRYLHGRAAEWFEEHGGLASAAFHYEQAGRVKDMTRTGLQAASRAEQAGMYHTALMLYQKIRPHMSIEELGPRLGHALIVLGDWDEAEDLAGRLPESDGRVRLLRSELRFVRGDFEGAREEAEAAASGPSADRIQAVIRLADIDLYLGNFSRAQRHGYTALQLATESASGNLCARCLGIIAATEFFGGEIEAAGRRFSEALQLIKDVAEADRDRTVYTTILGNLGNVAEAKGDWPAAEQFHGEALRLRREVADTRGVLHSLHALGRSLIGLGDREGGMAYIAEAEQLATDLNEPLERAKIWHTRADLHLRNGDWRISASHGRAMTWLTPRSP